ncbi:MAG: DUF2141 domain-containing protein [Flavobacteriales bacterium]|nr:DUF2141 domain-containing protein [Flavobacteriales bacterium]
MKYLLLICFAISSLNGYSQSYDLKIEIRNIKELKGNIFVSIYNKSDDFPKKGKHYQNNTTPANNYSETIFFKNLPVGDYAVALFHDRNSDDKLNKNLFGLPKEGYGFSNNCKPIFSAPSFKCTKFNLSSDKSIIIELIY